MYEPLHGYLAVGVCVLGCMFNMVNILVLTHKDMRTNPINLLLTGIAVADMMVMMEYIPFAIHMYLFQGTPRTMEEKVSLKSLL
jgi:ABC-type Fe3+-siderophore transport system permease subunit